MPKYHDEPQTRVEAILQNILGENNQLQPPQTRVEELLLELLDQGVGGVTYKGVTTTPLTDGCDTNPIVINGEEVEAKVGDFVAYGGAEFVWNGTVWQELGDLSIVTALMDSIAPQYDPSETYHIGSIVFKDNILYECNTDDTTGTWDISKWNEIVLSDIIEALYAALARANVQETPTDTLKNIKIGNTVYSTTVTKLLSGSEYNSLTPEQKNDGTIYLVDTSKPEIVPFATGTDEQINTMLDAYYADKLTWAEMGWNIGDTRVIHLNAMKGPAPYYENWAAQNITVVIVAHDHTDLAEPINGHTKACITVQTRETLSGIRAGTEGKIYITGDTSYDMTFTKWSNLYMRTYINSTVFNAFPSTLKPIIKPSSHYRHTTYNGTASEQVTDTLFLPSYPEVFGTASYDYYVATNPVEGTQFDYYTTSSNRTKWVNNNGLKSSYNSDWWEGSVSSYYHSYFGYSWCRVKYDTTTAYSDGTYFNGLAPAFTM